MVCFTAVFQDVFIKKELYMTSRLSSELGTRIGTWQVRMYSDPGTSIVLYIFRVLVSYP